MLGGGAALPLPWVCWSAASTVPSGSTLVCWRMNSCVDGMLGVDSSTRPMCWVCRWLNTVLESSQLLCAAAGDSAGMCRTTPVVPSACGTTTRGPHKAASVVGDQRCDDLQCTPQPLICAAAPPLSPLTSLKVELNLECSSLVLNAARSSTVVGGAHPPPPRLPSAIAAVLLD